MATYIFTKHFINEAEWMNTTRFIGIPPPTNWKGLTDSDNGKKHGTCDNKTVVNHKVKQRIPPTPTTFRIKQSEACKTSSCARLSPAFVPTMSSAVPTHDRFGDQGSSHAQPSPDPYPRIDIVVNKLPSIFKYVIGRVRIFTCLTATTTGRIRILRGRKSHMVEELTTYFGTPSFYVYQIGAACRTASTCLKCWRHAQSPLNPGTRTWARGLACESKVTTVAIETVPHMSG